MQVRAQKQVHVGDILVQTHMDTAPPAADGAHHVLQTHGEASLGVILGDGDVDKTVGLQNILIEQPFLQGLGLLDSDFHKAALVHNSTTARGSLMASTAALMPELA